MLNLKKKIVRKARHSGTKPVFHACMFINHFGQLTSIFQNLIKNNLLISFWNWHFMALFFLKFWSFICYSSSFSFSTFHIYGKCSIFFLDFTNHIFYFSIWAPEINNDYDYDYEYCCPTYWNTERCCRKVAEKQTATRTAWR